MSHKVHPKAFRIKELSDWNSRGFYNKNFAQCLEEDFKIREILKRKLKDCGIEKIEIERFPAKLNIVISTSRPGLIIGRGGRGSEEIKKILDREISQKSLLDAGVAKGKVKKTVPAIKIEIRGIRDIWANPNLVIEWIAQRLEKRMPYRRVLKQASDKIMAVKTVKGTRIEVSGRLGGVEISRSEWLQKGNLPRQTIRANIDYGSGLAHCSYGVIGIKVWIYKGERFAK